MSHTLWLVVICRGSWDFAESLVWLLEELGLEYDVKVYARLPTRAAPPELKQANPFGKVYHSLRLSSSSLQVPIYHLGSADITQAPAVELDGKLLVESGYIAHKLISSFPNSKVERDASDDSTFWSHFSEGSLMTQLQLGISVLITSGAVASGQMPGVEMGEEGRKAVGQYGKILMVSTA